MRRLALVAAIVVAASSLTACGSRLSDAEVLAQASGGRAVAPAAVDASVGTAEIPGAPVAAVTASGDQPAAAAPVPAAAGKNLPAPGAKASSGPRPVAAAAPVSGTPVNIGSIGLYSGFAGQLLGGTKLGTQVAVAHINARGGLNGHPINLIVADDGGDPATGLSLAKKMIDEDHVIAFLNNMHSTNSGSLYPYITGRGVPLIGGVGVEPENWTLPGAFPGASSPKFQATLAVKTLIDDGFKKIGIIYCTEFNLLCKTNSAAVEANAPQVGGDVVFKQQVSLAQPDYTSQCLAAKGAGVDNFLLFMDPSAVVRLVDACAAQNFYPHYATVGVVLAASLTSTPNTEGLIGPPNSFPFSYSGPESAELRRAFSEIAGVAPTSNFQASAWMGGLILREAGKRLPADPRPDDVFAGLYAIKANDFGGLAPAPWTFRPGEPANSPLCGHMTQIHDGAFVALGGLKPRCLTGFTPADFR